MPQALERSLRKSARKRARKKHLKAGTKKYKKFIGRYVYGSQAMQNWRASHPPRRTKR